MLELKNICFTRDNKKILDNINFKLDNKTLKEILNIRSPSIEIS